MKKMSINDLDSLERLVDKEVESLAFSDERVFALRVKDDGMIDAGILSGDFVIIRKQEIAQPDEIIVAMLGEGKIVLRYLHKEGQQYFLDSANSKYKSILVDENVCIVGKVIHVVRQIGKLAG